MLWNSKYLRYSGLFWGLLWFWDCILLQPVNLLACGWIGWFLHGAGFQLVEIYEQILVLELLFHGFNFFI